MKSVHHEVRFQAYNQLMDLVNNNQVWTQVWTQVWDQVRNQVWTQVWTQVSNQVEDEGL